MVQSGQFDHRAASSAAYTRAIMAPQYATSMPYSTAPSGTIVTQLPHPQQNPFSGPTYGHNPNVPPFAANYIQARPQVQMPPHRSQPRPSRQTGYSTQQHSPLIKHEISPTSSLNINLNMNGNSTASDYSTSTTPTSVPGDVNFGTHVDTLMKAIQTKATTTPRPQSMSPVEHKSVVGYSPSAQRSLGYMDANDKKQNLTNSDYQDEKSASKRYRCDIPGCGKAFHQKTHLEIHVRAHTGQKPYVST